MQKLASPKNIRSPMAMLSIDTLLQIYRTPEDRRIW